MSANRHSPSPVLPRTHSPGGRLWLYVRLVRAHRPIGTLLLLWPTLWALWIAADGHPSAALVTIFVLGTFVMRSAGCIINDYADRDFDAHVERTRDRPLATGEISVRGALTLAAALLAVALALLLMLNRLTIAYGLVGAALAATYPFVKRLTHLPQVYLGFAFGWGVPMAFAAVGEAVPPVGWLIFATVVLWAVIYDTMYAMCDRPDDLRIGIKSTAVLLGNADRPVIAAMQVVLILALISIGRQAGVSGAWYHLGVAVAAGLCLYQQYLIRNRERAACLRAFLNNNWLGAAVFAGLVAQYLTR